jgi:hypothetical protein
MKIIKTALLLLLAGFCSMAASEETVYAVIQNGVVTNTIVAEQPFIDQHYPGSPRIDNVTPQPGIGWGYDGATWTAPQTFAVVAGGIVAQVVTGLPSKISAQYPGAIRIDNLNPMPGVGWTYDGSTFTAPSK